MSEWISVNQQLPSYKQCILVFLDAGIIAEAVYRGEYDANLYCFRIELTREDLLCKLGERISHWMPLPELPK